MPVSILIADDHGVLRAGLRSLLDAEPNFKVVGEAADGHETVRVAQELCPDLILLDISMPGLDGIEVTKIIKAKLPKTQILMLTAHEDHALLLEAIRAGASGYVVKRAVEPELTSAIGAVMRGDLYVDPAVTRALIPQAAGQSPSRPDYVEVLTPREIEVLQLIAEGNTNVQIAEVLTLSVRTVESHRANIMDKLHLNNRAELVRYARDRGLLGTKA